MARMSFTPIYPQNTVGKWFTKACSAVGALAALLLVMGTVHAEDRWLKNELKTDVPSVFVDNWTARDCATQSTYTMVFVEMSPADLVFVSDRGGYLSRFTLGVSVIGEDDEPLAEQVVTDSVRVDHYSETHSYDWNRLYRFSFELPAGEQVALIHLTDLNSGNDAVKLVGLDVQTFSAPDLDVSEILMARRDQVEAADKTLKFSVVPFPGRIYGQEQPQVITYFEIYQPAAADQESGLEFAVSYIDPQNRQVYVDKKTLSRQCAKTPVMSSFDTSTLSPGVYKMLVEVKSRDGRFQLEREKEFLVYQSPVDLHFRPFEEILEELRLITSKEEWNALHEMAEVTDGSLQARQEAIYQFWAQRDPTPGTVRNEQMTEFYKRVNFARQNFPERGDAKKLSDQGKVYVRYGAPDQIVRQAAINLVGYIEVWQYRGKALQVEFRDDFGFGDFRLVAPYQLLGDL